MRYIYRFLIKLTAFWAVAIKISALVWQIEALTTRKFLISVLGIKWIIMSSFISSNVLSSKIVKVIKSRQHLVLPASAGLNVHREILEIKRQ